ncbi:hypothetical protein OUZ56_026108 [Daphnia magna]|uniref:Uncharacterized protein n=1 Tax=Daphnia magna TaxID=35525 RepID=A0ABQ9ZM58_9CRUS|nr:hypothetical protein OUZ56_026108 [Daphnia magna]
MSCVLTPGTIGGPASSSHSAASCPAASLYEYHFCAAPDSDSSTWSRSSSSPHRLYLPILSYRCIHCTTSSPSFPEGGWGLEFYLCGHRVPCAHLLLSCSESPDVATDIRRSSSQIREIPLWLLFSVFSRSFFLFGVLPPLSFLLTECEMILLLNGCRTLLLLGFVSPVLYFSSLFRSAFPQRSTARPRPPLGCTPDLGYTPTTPCHEPSPSVSDSLPAPYVLLSYHLLPTILAPPVSCRTLRLPVHFSASCQQLRLTVHFSASCRKLRLTVHCPDSCLGEEAEK